jgi:hypothetical protein
VFMDDQRLLWITGIRLCRPSAGAVKQRVRGQYARSVVYFLAAYRGLRCCDGESKSWRPRS